MKVFSAILILLVTSECYGQELFVYTEPASNMPAKSFGIRLSNTFMKVSNSSKANYHVLPEIMWGANKNLMLHVEGFISSRNNGLGEGVGVYGKYRFLSKDAVHNHFRMAAYARASKNYSPIHYEEIEVNGFNSGFEMGTIVTQLLHKVAISASAGFERAGDNGKFNKFPVHHARDAFNYTLSAGKLILPKEYKNYRQVNLNLMAEIIVQRLNANGKYFVDIAPSVQFIFNSQSRVDFGYRNQVKGNIMRPAPESFMLRFEHLLFNVL